MLALIRSLKRSKTIYPICVLTVENNVSTETVKQIQNEGASIRFIEGLHPKQDAQNLVFARFSLAWTKLRAFEVTDIAEKCVFLDLDAIVLNNLDDIFQLEDNPDFAAVQTCICNPEKRPNYPEHYIRTIFIRKISILNFDNSTVAYFYIIRIKKCSKKCSIV